MSRQRPVRIARPHLHHHRRIGAHHLLRVDDGLGHAGRAGGEQQLADGIGRDLRDRLLDVFGHRRRREIGKGNALDALAGPRDMNDGDAVEIERVQRLLEGRAVLHHHHGRLDQVEQIFQLEVILAHQRIGRRHRRRRKARLHRGLRHQRMLDRIAREDRDRTAGFAGRDRAAPASAHRRCAWLRHRKPCAIAGRRRRAARAKCAPALPWPISPARPGCASRKPCSGMRDFKMIDAVGPPLDRDVALQPFDLAKGGLGQHRGCIPTHYCVSRNSCPLRILLVIA